MQNPHISSPAHVVFNITRSPRWRSLILTILLLIITCWTWQTHCGTRSIRSRDNDEHSTKSPLLQVSSTTKGLKSGDTTTASQSSKENQQFHLFIHAPHINLAVCRCILSSFILDYPPPTLIGYTPADPSLSLRTTSADHDRGASEERSRVADISDYLHSQDRINDDDKVLIVDGETTLFQLPPEALLSEYAKARKLRNQQLAAAHCEKPPVFFGSNTASGEEDESKDSLSDAFILGSAKSVRRVFDAARKSDRQIAQSDSATFKRLFAQQESARVVAYDEPTLMTIIKRLWKQWSSPHPQPQVNNAASGGETSEKQTASLSDLGMSIDDGRLISIIPNINDNTLNIPAKITSNTVTNEERGVKSAHLPAVLLKQNARQPFGLHTVHLHPTVSPPSLALDSSPSTSLPPPSTPWSSLPLFPSWSNSQNAIPPLLTLPSSSPSTANHIYERMWFRPHAHALLHSYLLRSASQELAAEAAAGGQKWWDRRGGRGGVWTVDGSWIDAGELCGGFSETLFGEVDEHADGSGGEEGDGKGGRGGGGGEGRGRIPQWTELVWGRLNSAEDPERRRGRRVLVVDGKGKIVGFRVGGAGEASSGSADV